MISLLGSLLGFGSSLIGPVLETWNKNSDQKHELAMLHAQAEVQSKIQDQKLEATIVEADMAEIVAAHKEQASTVRKGPVWLAALVDNHSKWIVGALCRSRSWTSAARPPLRAFTSPLRRFTSCLVGRLTCSLRSGPCLRAKPVSCLARQDVRAPSDRLSQHLQRPAVQTPRNS